MSITAIPIAGLPLYQLDLHHQDVFTAHHSGESNWYLTYEVISFT